MKPAIVMEYLPNGDLKTFLSVSFSIRERTSCHNGISLTNYHRILPTTEK